jgi:hypothetical protein
VSFSLPLFPLLLLLTYDVVVVVVG